MKDEAVERVLQGLGRVEAPRGMEGRVLQRLAEGKEGRSHVWGWSFGLAGGIASIGLLLAWNVGVFERGGGAHTPGAKAPFMGAGVRPKAEAFGYLPTDATAPADSSASLRNDKQTSLRDHKQAVLWRDGQGSAASTHVSEATHGAAGLVVGVESFPAPPEPLTEQEKLLRQIALAGSQPAFELLNEETREAALAASDAEFEAFVRSARSDGRAAKNLDLQR